MGGMIIKRRHKRVETTPPPSASKISHTPQLREYFCDKEVTQKQHAVEQRNELLFFIYLLLINRTVSFR